MGCLLFPLARPPFSEVIATPYLAGTPMIRGLLSSARGQNRQGAFIGRCNIDTADLVSIGEDAIVVPHAQPSHQFGRARIASVGNGHDRAGAFVGSMAVVEDATARCR